MRMPERQQIIIIAVAVVLAAGFALFSYIPLARRKNAVVQAGTEQSAVFTKVKEYYSQLPLLRSQLDELRDDTVDFQAAIPKDSSFAGLWQQIADVMNRHNLTEQIIQPAEQIRGSDICCVPIDIECTGNTEQIFAVLKSLGSFDRLIRIETLKLLNKDDFSGLVRLTIRADVYYQPAKGHVAS